MADIAQLKLTQTYRDIANRLANFSPGIDIEKHIYNDILEVGRDTLEGISFKAKNPERLKYALRNIRDVHGEPAFAEGSKEDMSHWALAKSFSKTHGTGFREIWRPKLDERPLSYADSRRNRYSPEWTRHLSSGFGDALDVPDLSSVHCAVADDICNIHIDQMGFVFAGWNGEIIVGPDFLRHTVIELLWKTDARKYVPDWVVDHVNFVLPSSYNNFQRVGLSFEANLARNVKVELSGTCAIHGGFECSANLSLSGKFDWLGSK